MANVVFVCMAAAALLGLWRAGVLLFALHRERVGSGAILEVALVCGGFSLGMALLLAGLRLPPTRRVKAALALGSCAAALYLAEAGAAFDDRVSRRLQEKAALIESLKRQRVMAYGGVEPVRLLWARERGSPSWLSVDGRPTLPLAGISRRTTVDCKEADDAPWLVFETDERGFHNPPGAWSRPVELAAVGDSFTHGSCVGSDQNLLAGIRRRYPTALNLGAAGSGPLLMLAEIREYLPAIRPRLVLWCHFGGNDLRDLRRERRHPILARYLDPGFRQRLPERQAAVDAAIERYSSTWRWRDDARLARQGSSLSDFLGLRATRTRLGLAFPDPGAYAPNPDEFRLFEDVLRHARWTVESWGGRLIFVYLPGWEAPVRQAGERGIRELEARARARVLATARALGLPLIDVARAFAAHPESARLFACPGCHYGPGGYAVAADAVLAALQELDPLR